MKIVLTVVQIILSLAITGLIFIQSNGDTESKSNILSSTNFEKRGWEKAVFTFTIVIIGIFLVSSIIQSII
jgi:protein translocase SecG subunit